MQFSWMAHVRAVSLDLDDTLWPIEGCIAAAEQVLHEWLAQRIEGFRQHCGVVGLRRWRECVEQDWPASLAHDLSALRRESIRRALADMGADEALVAPAFEVFVAVRQQVTYFADAQPALDRLARRFPLFAITNGNADLQRTGLSRWLGGGVTAVEVGAAKPDPRIFAHACERLGLAPHQILHVGDDPVKDVAGARSAGLMTAWLQRPGSPHGPDACEPHIRAADLLELARLLGA